MPTTVSTQINRIQRAALLKYGTDRKKWSIDVWKRVLFSDRSCPELFHTRKLGRGRGGSLAPFSDLGPLGGHILRNKIYYLNFLKGVSKKGKNVEVNQKLHTLNFMSLFRLMFLVGFYPWRGASGWAALCPSPPSITTSYALLQ